MTRVSHARHRARTRDSGTGHGADASFARSPGVPGNSEAVMKKNMGGIDRGVRLVLGLVILGYGLRHHAWWGWLGIIPILTAIVAVCPGYLPFRFSTRREPPAKPAA